MTEEDNIEPRKRASKLTSWKNEPTYRDLYKDYQSAQNDHAEIVGEIERRYQYLEGGPLPKIPKGKSTMRPKVIRKQAEWKYPALEEPFLNTQNMFEIKPRTWEDAESAKQNAILINYQWDVKIDKVELVGDIVRTIVDEGTVVVKTGWEFEEEEIEVEEEVPVYATPEESLMMYEEAVNRGMLSAEQAQQLMAAGKPFPKGIKKVRKKKRVVVKNQPSYEVCDNTNIILDPTAKEKSQLRFIIHEYETDMSELKKQEYRTWTEEDPETGEEIEYESGIYRNLDKIHVDDENDEGYYDTNNPSETDFEFQDKPRKKLTAYEYWGYWDIDDDGEVELIVATWVDGVIIRMEENPFPFDELPFSIAQYLPRKGTLYGESDGDLLRENQDSIGKMTRAAHDITSDQAVGQEFIDEDFFAGPSQKENYKAGRTVFFRHGFDPRTAIYKQSVDPVPPAVFNMIQWQQNEVESMSGTKSFSQGIGSQALGSVATGIRSALDATAKRELSILRRLSEHIFKDLARKTIMMNQAFLEPEEVVRVTNSEYITIKRDDIQGEFDIIVDVSTPEKDNEMAQQLMTMMQTNAPGMDPNISKMIYAKMMTLWKMPDLAHEIMTYEPQPDPAEEQMKQLQMENAALENRLLKMQLAKLAKDIESEDSKILERNSRTAQNLESETDENLATARLKNAQAAKLEAETDLKDLEFVRKQEGVDREEQKEDKEFEHLSKQEIELQKMHAKLAQEKEKAKQNRYGNVADTLIQEAVTPTMEPAAPMDTTGSVNEQQIPTQGMNDGTI